MPAEEAWQIDTKMDDGTPGNGKMRAYVGSRRTDCTSTADAATAEYILSNATRGCNLIFLP